MGQDRMNSWRASMLVKVQMIRSLVTRNQGKIVVVSDADHTFFPGWKRTVLECLQTADVCFEFHMRYDDDDMEQQKVHTLMNLNMPWLRYWDFGELSTGIIAIRCNVESLTLMHKWALFIQRRLLAGEPVHDQNAMNVVILHEQPYPGGKWRIGFLDPYAVNRAPWRVHHSNNPQRVKGCLAEHLEDRMLIHHTAGVHNPKRYCQIKGLCSSEDRANGVCFEEALACKILHLRSVNHTWYRMRGLAKAFDAPEAHDPIALRCSRCGGVRRLGCCEYSPPHHRRHF